MSLQQLLEPRTSQHQLVYVSLLKLNVRFPITKQNSARVEDVDYNPKESYVLMEIECGSDQTVFCFTDYSVKRWFIFSTQVYASHCVTRVSLRLFCHVFETISNKQIRCLAFSLHRHGVGSVNTVTVSVQSFAMTASSSMVPIDLTLAIGYVVLVGTDLFHQISAGRYRQQQSQHSRINDFDIDDFCQTDRY